ncbi:hypothetical protein E2C01_091098 [Portunus trituberculatus]|uniref:Uncharacterized protein n=1 Tax=Portunus trituberculatus TaxID=210409 RepID=A0A5B7JM35_PORTR|nr:hypothetical protein [Portunus trituberculatus]
MDEVVEAVMAARGGPGGGEDTGFLWFMEGAALGATIARGREIQWEVVVVVVVRVMLRGVVKALPPRTHHTLL